MPTTVRQGEESAEAHCLLLLGDKPLTDRIVDNVKRLLIRHSKSQRIQARWYLALMLLRNPCLILERRHHEELVKKIALKEKAKEKRRRTVTYKERQEALKEISGSKRDE